MKRIVTAWLILAAAAGAKDKPFKPLFDGKTLAGWEVCNGQATYKVEKGVIVGTTVPGSPNSFLCTTREYGDFVLEFDVLVDPALNSGVQIRSHRYAAETRVRTLNGTEYVDRVQKPGRFYGYQVEIATEKSGASGGIYDEARRGWLANISSDPSASKAFKDNQWNRYRVEAMGDRIQTWINGVKCADLVDAADQSGFIGLQVHAYTGDKPAQVRFRKLRIQDLGRHVWKPVWDGQTLAGWRHAGGGTFEVVDGAIQAHSNPGDERIGMLVSDRTVADDTIRLEYKIAHGNSGFFVRADPKTYAGYEVEIDEFKRSGGMWEPGGRRWVTGPEDNAAARPGEWNELIASVHGRRIVFFLNGVKTVDMPNDAAGVSLSGRIALQTHGSKKPTQVWFRNVAVLQPEK
jgi:hypothetical protein